MTIAATATAQITCYSGSDNSITTVSTENPVILLSASDTISIALPPDAPTLLMV